MLEQRIMTRVDERFAGQDAELEARFDRQDTRFDKQDARFDNHEAILVRLDRTLLLHTWMLGFPVLAPGVPAVPGLSHGPERACGRCARG